MANLGKWQGSKSRCSSANSSGLINGSSGCISTVALTLPSAAKVNASCKQVMVGRLEIQSYAFLTALKPRGSRSTSPPRWRSPSIGIPSTNRQVMGLFETAVCRSYRTETRASSWLALGSTIANVATSSGHCRNMPHIPCRTSSAMWAPLKNDEEMFHEPAVLQHRVYAFRHAPLCNRSISHYL